MKFHVGLNKSEIEINSGDYIEAIIRSELYCSKDESVVYHSGRVMSIEENGVWLKYDEDDLHVNDDSEFLSFDDVEYVHHKEYEILGYAIHRQEMVISVKGKLFSGKIRFIYNEGSLSPVYEEEVNKDRIKEMKLNSYGMYQTLAQHVLR